jgi:probable HAF family extracellular repeat protein
VSRSLRFLHLHQLTLSALLALATALFIPTQLAAQNSQDGPKHHHYKLINLGTLGGATSGFNGEPTGNFMNPSGTIVGVAETAIPVPPVLNCFNPISFPDCLISHAFEWRGNGLQDLGTLPGGYYSFAFAVNARGQIVGVSENNQIDPDLGTPVYRAVLWQKGMIRDLGTLGGTSSFAQSINDPGQIIGQALNSIPDPYSMIGGSTQTHAFLWDEGVMQDLGTLGGPDSFAVFENNRGQVAGFSYTSDVPDPNSGVPPIHPFLWTKGKGMQDLGNFGGANGLSFAFCCAIDGLNDRGQVTGAMQLPSDQTDKNGNLISHAFLWDGKQLVELGTLGGSSAFAYGLNNAAAIIGNSYLPGDQVFHAYRWEKGVMTDLGTVEGDTCSTPASINSKGQIVGSSQDATCDPYTRAALWENGEPAVDLNTLIPPNSPLQLKVASLINERGEIVGGGGPPGCPVDDDGCAVVFVLIPCDENHPGVQGCDYSLVDAAATAETRLTQVDQPAVQPSVARLTPAEMMTRFHSAMSGRNLWLRRLLRTLAQK